MKGPQSNRITIAIITVILCWSAAITTRAQETKLKWFGHAAFGITTPNGKIILIDPWINNPANPEARDGKDALAAIPTADYILLTHGHRNQGGDAVAIARRTHAILICNPELAANLVKLADFPAKEAQSEYIMQIGSEVKIAEGEVTVAMTPAVHSSSVFNAKAGPNEPERAYGGSPAGFVIMIKNGPTFYHTGDTAYFRDMEVIGETYPIDVALINISAMGPKMSARAAQSLRARMVIPHHFGTFPELLPDTNSFTAEIKKLKIGIYEMKPGETATFRGKQLVKSG